MGGVFGQNVYVGPGAVIGAGAVVTRDVPDFALITGNPGRQHGWICRCGVRLKLKGLGGLGWWSYMACRRTFTIWIVARKNRKKWMEEATARV